MQHIPNSVISVRREIVTFPSHKVSKTISNFTQTVLHSTLLRLLETLDYIERLNEAQKSMNKTLDVSSLFSVGAGKVVAYLRKFIGPANNPVQFNDCCEHSSKLNYM